MGATEILELKQQPGFQTCIRTSCRERLPKALGGFRANGQRRHSRTVCNFEHILVLERIRFGWYESGRSLADIGKVKNPPTPSVLFPGVFV
jgi:hypothetical protein